MYPGGGTQIDNRTFWFLLFAKLPMAVCPLGEEVFDLAKMDAWQIFLDILDKISDILHIKDFLLQKT